MRPRTELFGLKEGRGPLGRQKRFHVERGASLLGPYRASSKGPNNNSLAGLAGRPGRSRPCQDTHRPTYPAREHARLQTSPIVASLLPCWNYWLALLKYGYPTLLRPPAYPARTAGLPGDSTQLPDSMHLPTLLEHRATRPKRISPIELEYYPARAIGTSCSNTSYPAEAASLSGGSIWLPC